MNAYSVDLAPIPGHTIPPLLKQFGTWLGKQEYGSLGWFGLHATIIPLEWKPEKAKQLQRDGFSFLHIPDGSLLCLLNTGSKSPPAVVLLGSEGESGTIANSLEEFLVLLSKGETGIMELDLEEATIRPKLRAWLSRNKIDIPKTTAFDFDAYLDGAAQPTISTSTGKAPSQIVAGLPAIIHQLVSLLGRRADDPELVDFVTKTLGQKVPNSTTDVSSMKHVVVKKSGFELGFGHDVKNEKYPLIQKSKTSFLPYLSYVWFNEKFAKSLPFGLQFGLPSETLTQILGKPGEIGTGRHLRAYWTMMLDSARDILLCVDQGSKFGILPKSEKINLKIKEALELISRSEISNPINGIFLAWALNRDLIDETQFAEHTTLIASVRRRNQKGSAFWDAAFPRGLWDIHLKDKPSLRHFCFEWFHNIGDKFFVQDLIGVFGSRTGPYGHPEPILEDDSWEHVDRATPALDKRFAMWVK